MAENTINTNKIIVNADLGEKRISKHIYGHFAEHLGHCIYGGFWTGDDSKIPNTRGIRKDVVEALRQVSIPNLRWPGGCFADEYHWEDGIGPRDKRPSMINTHWGGVTENNHFGTHEFMDLCDQLGCEPYICGNVGSGTVKEMARWVEYLSLDGKSPMADLRKENGREKSWALRFWGVGNENWGCGGNMRAEYYADLYRRYSTYCRDFSAPGNSDNRCKCKRGLYKIAGGANADDYHWTEVLMREAGQFMDGLSLHYYTITGVWGNKGSATRFSEKEWFTTLQKALFMENLILNHSAIMDRYDPEKRVGLIVDEWGTWHDVEPGTNPGFLFQQNSMRDALVAGLSLNIFNNHCDRVFMANIAQTVNVLQSMVLTKDEKMVLTPTYHVFEMYKEHQDATLIPVDVKCETYSNGKDSIPAVSVSASRNGDGQVHLSLCNLDPGRIMDVSCEFRGMTLLKATGRLLAGGGINAHNTFKHPDTLTPVAFEGMVLDGNRVNVKLPAASVVVLKLQ